MDIGIVGCGNIGSYLSYFLYQNIIPNKINTIYLIDNDILEPKNFPYLFINSRNRIGKKYISNKKVYALKDILEHYIRLDNNIHIVPLGIYYDNTDLSINNNTMLIDCRDNLNEFSNFKLKLSIDGSFGKIVVNPKDNNINKKEPYRLRKNRFYSQLFCTLIVNSWKNLLNYKDRAEFILDLKEFRIMI